MSATSTRRNKKKLDVTDFRKCRTKKKCIIENGFVLTGSYFFLVFFLQFFRELYQCSFTWTTRAFKWSFGVDSFELWLSPIMTKRQRWKLDEKIYAELHCMMRWRPYTEQLALWKMYVLNWCVLKFGWYALTFSNSKRWNRSTWIACTI